MIILAHKFNKRKKLKHDYVNGIKPFINDVRPNLSSTNENKLLSYVSEIDLNTVIKSIIEWHINDTIRCI